MLFTESPTSQVAVHLSEEEDRGEAGPPHGTYIIPIDDITTETKSGSALDAVRYERGKVSRMNQHFQQQHDEYLLQNKEIQQQIILFMNEQTKCCR